MPPEAARVWEYATKTSPPGSEVVKMVTPPMVMDRFAVGEVTLSLSFTVTLNEDVPVVVGVPLMTPLVAFRDNPAGSDPPVTVQVYGGVPPLGVKVWEYATPTSPPGRDVVVMVGSAAIVMDRVATGEMLPRLSLTVTPNDGAPAVVGVPLMTPLVAFRDNPAGSDPLLTVQLLYGGVPPLAPRVWEYATATSPPGSEVVKMVTPVMAMDRFAVAVPPSLSVTVTVNEDVPVVVGVPLMTPVDGARVRPGGSVPVLSAHVYGFVPPEAARVWEYATPTSPPGRDVVVMVGPVPISMDNALAAAVLPRLSWTVTLKSEVPTGPLGVPLIMPLDDPRVKPGGSDPLLTFQLL